jgi:hypothetical protein
MSQSIQDHLDSVIQQMDEEIGSVYHEKTGHHAFSVMASDVEQLSIIRLNIKSHLDSIKKLSNEMEQVMDRITKQNT